MIKTRRKLGLRCAQKMYHGGAVAQKATIAIGCRQRNASRHRLVRMPQSKTEPPERTIAAGPLAKAARPRKKPKRSRASQGVRGKIGVFPSFMSPSTKAAHIIATVSMAANGISVAAACEKPIIPTVVGKRSNNQRADSAP